MKMNFKILAIGFALVSALVLSGCHTVNGMSQDVQSGGNAVHRAFSN
jgi:predicted small secreted protein